MIQYLLHNVVCIFISKQNKNMTVLLQCIAVLPLKHTQSQQGTWLLSFKQNSAEAEG